MQEALSLDDVVDRVYEDDVGKWDTVVPRNTLSMLDGDLVIKGALAVSLTPWAASQMCGRLGIPYSYFRKCPPHLMDDQFNYWVRQEDTTESWLLRSKSENLRAVLSDRYSPLDNATLLASLEPFLGTRFDVSWLAITDESFHLRLVDRALSRDVLRDDRLFAGIHIANSEAGKRCVSIDAIVYRLVCTNGLIKLIDGRPVLHQRHQFISPTQFELTLSAGIEQAIQAASGFLEQFASAANTHLTDVEQTIEAAFTRYDLPETLKENITDALLRQPSCLQDTVYGLVNAMTEVAQKLPPDDRYDIEVIAGKLLEEERQKALLT